MWDANRTLNRRHATLAEPPVGKLGRLPAVDPRDKAFRMATIIPPVTRRYRYYWNGWWGDQGQSSACVGFSWTAWLTSSPVTQTARDWQAHAFLTYDEAQKVDEWDGKAYDGTSVRAGAKSLQARGFITEYRWAWTADEVVRAVLEVGPVVVGTVWTESMFYPVNGEIKPDGAEVGGHAYLIDGASLDRGVVRLKNSWGRSWGKAGRAFMTIANLQQLMSRDGEGCLAVEVKA